MDHYPDAEATIQAWRDGRYVEQNDFEVAKIHAMLAIVVELRHVVRELKRNNRWERERES
jgi:hypothetical protein